MSEVSELARAEGDRAEAESPDESETPETPETPLEGDVPEPEPETGDQPPETVVPDEQAQAFDKAGKRAKTYMTAVPDILGEAAQDLLLCPRCTDFLPGWVLPLSIKPVSPEQKVAVKQSIGELVEPELRQAEDAFTCEKCGGWGEVLTGSQKVSQAKAKCLECNGTGWVGSRKDKVARMPPEEREALREPEEGPHEPAPLTDPWGRTRDDPLYGVMPGFERD